MENLFFTIFLTIIFSGGLGISRYRWFYRDGKMNSKYIVIIEIISFVILELILAYVFFFE